MKTHLFLLGLFGFLCSEMQIQPIAIKNNSKNRMYVMIQWGDGAYYKGDWAKPGKCVRYRSGVNYNQVYACESSLGGVFTCSNKSLKDTYKHYADGDESYHVSDDDMLIFSGASLYTDNNQDADKVC